MTSLIKKPKSLFPTVFTDFFDTDKFFGRDFERDMVSWVPVVNIIENNKYFHIELAVPGMKKDDFKINVEDDVLTISGDKKEDKTEEDFHFTRREFSYGSFSRSFRLPNTVNAENIEGKYEDGVLKLDIPKKEEAITKPRKEIRLK